jgi:hypothetical protein
MTDYIKEFQDLISHFINHEMNGENFCDEYVSLWIRDRDEAYAIKNNWPEPYDQILSEAFIKGQITKDEFALQYKKLFPTNETDEFRFMVDSIHTTCLLFDPQPVCDWELDEVQFRAEVKETFVKYQSTIS